MKNLSSMLKEAQKLQGKMTEMQQQLAEMQILGSSGGGMVNVTLNGRGEMQAIKIDKSLMEPDDIEVLEDLVVAATNDARTKVDAKMQEEMGKMTGGLPLPPGMKLPF